jgi:translocation and assembly module TamB
VRGPASITADIASAAEGWDIDADLSGPGGLTVRAEGLVGLEDGRVDLETEGSVPLALANRFIAPRSIDGRLSFDLRIAGAPGLDAVSGNFTTTGTRIAAPTARLALENVGLSGSLSGGRVSFDGSGAVSSGGQIGLSGTVDVGGPGIPGAVDITLNGVRLVDPSLYEVLLAQGALSVTGPLSVAPRVAGRIDLGQSEIRVPETGLGSAPAIPDIRHVGETGAQRSTRAAAGLLARQSGSGGSGAVGLDLEINAPGRIFLRGRGIDAEFGGAIRIAGTSAAVIPSGQFDLIRGRISILGTRLDLTEGSATLQGDFDPFLRLRAESRAGGYRIIISVEGPPPPPTSRSAPTPSCRRTRSSRSFSSGAPSRPCRRSSFCNWPMPRARLRAAAPMAGFCRTCARGWASMIWTCRPTTKATPPCAPGATCRTTSTPMSPSTRRAKARCRSTST